MDPASESDVPDDSLADFTWRRMWLSRRALVMHLTLAIVVPGFLALFWWQVQRVREGNTLSWAYVFEWPFFSGYAVYMWWILIHDRFGPSSRVRKGAPAASGGSMLARRSHRRVAQRALLDARADEDMAAYNRYLESLDEDRKPNH